MSCPYNFAFYYYDVTFYGKKVSASTIRVTFYKNNSIATWAVSLYPYRSTKGYTANYLSYRANVRVYHPGHK